MGSWRDCSLGDVLTLQRGFDLPVQERTGGTVPVIASTGPVGWHDKAQVVGPGVVIGRSGSIGGGQFIRDDFWPLNTTLWVSDFKGNDRRFCYFLLRSIDFSQFNVGSGVPTLNRNHVHPLDVRVPDKAQQERIGELLGSLDDKIELNRRMNQTLEAMAQAIFRDWFVDFGPVRRKMGGATDPVAIMGGLTPDANRAAELAAHFPGALGSDGVPTGWQETALLELARLISGGTPKTDNAGYWNGGVAWASAKDVSQCGEPFLLDTERTITALGLERSATKIVPKFATVVVARGATTGRFCMFGGDIAMNQTCYALESRGGTPFWLNCAFKELVSHLIQAAHGSVFDTITTSTFERTTLPGGPAELVLAFEAIVRPFFERVLSSLEENRTLAETRDYLLPRLMSGQVRVGDSEAMVA